MSQSILPQKLAFVDIETTGGRLHFDRVIEIGIIRVENGRVIKKYQTLINPHQPLSTEIVRLTNILPEELEAAPSFEEVAEAIEETLADCVFVAHNVRFDYSFLKEEFRRLERSFSPKQCCTVKLSRSWFPGQRHHNLDAVIERMGIKCQNRHRAFDDAQAIWEFFRRAKKLAGDETLAAAVNVAMSRPSLPIKISTEVLDQLPEATGVYIFYGQNEIPLYVGKSKNIRDRVMSHFSSDYFSNTEMKISQQVERIETIRTAGELGALLKEASLVKELQPLFNRKLRLRQKLVTANKVIDHDGYASVEIEVIEMIDPANLESIIGIFRNRKRAIEYLLTKGKEAGLCERRLGIEKGGGACFSYRLGRCKGACVGKELPIRYNLRFSQSFAGDGIRRWPFNSPVVIKERDYETGRSELFLVDRWCLLGRVEEGDLPIPSRLERVFDLDAYKILNSYLRSDQNLKNVEMVDQSTFKQLLQTC